METRRLLNSSGGVIREIIGDKYDPYAITTHLATQDCTALLRHVDAVRTSGAHRSTNGRVLAEVPVAIADQWFRDGSIHDQEFIKRWLRDGNNAAFRVDQKAI